ncbi:hypothetical protein F8388_013066 [Cannabis sativa]|uniref:Zinc knuckle CX2CX4HX4C domain-containing protein n=1 Tax=Cannabis sativa TaxID=3483 RepID=A0A7J6HGA3_CANSA|nr:hypothetical protein F8388_013066 [Cannabis sativa]KAF4393678.1 hypothetical protein G4B88_007664 [Cannabis sativa]
MTVGTDFQLRAVCNDKLRSPEEEFCSRIGVKKAKAKKNAPTFLDRIIKTRSMDAMLGVKEPEIPDRQWISQTSLVQQIRLLKMSLLGSKLLSQYGSNVVRSLERSFDGAKPLLVTLNYEKLGIFCYKCGRFGHQRRGRSHFLTPALVSSASPSPGLYRAGHLQSAMVASAFGTVRLKSVARYSRRASITTGRRSQEAGLSSHAMWVPKIQPAFCKPGSSFLGNKFRSGEFETRKESEFDPSFNLNCVDRRLTSGNEMCIRLGPIDCAIGLAISFSGPGLKKKEPIEIVMPNGPIIAGINRKTAQNLPRGTAPPFEHKEVSMNMDDGKRMGSCVLIGPAVESKNSMGCNSMNMFEINKTAKATSSVSSSCGQEVNVQHDEILALANFFQAQGSLVQELKKFSNLDLSEIKAIGGDFGVLSSLETNARTNPFKKRKLDGASTSLCSRPWKVPRCHPGVVRDFPWDTDVNANASKDAEEQPSEDISLSISDFSGANVWNTKGRK